MGKWGVPPRVRRQAPCVRWAGGGSPAAEGKAFPAAVRCEPVALPFPALPCIRPVLCQGLSGSCASALPGFGKRFESFSDPPGVGGPGLQASLLWPGHRPSRPPACPGNLVWRAALFSGDFPRPGAGLEVVCSTGPRHRGS